MTHSSVRATSQMQTVDDLFNWFRPSHTADQGKVLGHVMEGLDVRSGTPTRLLAPFTGLGRWADSADNTGSFFTSDAVVVCVGVFERHVERFVVFCFPLVTQMAFCDAFSTASCGRSRHESKRFLPFCGRDRARWFDGDDIVNTLLIRFIISSWQLRGSRRSSYSSDQSLKFIFIDGSILIYFSRVWSDGDSTPAPYGRPWRCWQSDSIVVVNLWEKVNI